MTEAEMSKAEFTVAYDGAALRDGTMDVRDLAPALLAIGQLFDAANTALNGENARLAVNVRATRPGSFAIALDVVQTYWQPIATFFAGDGVTAAVHLKEFIFTAGSGLAGLFVLIRWLRGRKPDKLERVDPDTIRVVVNGESLVVPLKVLRLYQDLAVRAAAEKVVAGPLSKQGIDTFAVPEHDLTITAADAPAFIQPEAEEDVLLDDVRRSAFSIVSLAFKEDNKWRLHDGNNQISAIINDREFIRRVDANEIAFAKGDVLICDVRIRQTQSTAGLKSEYTVEKVVEHKPAPRQLSLKIDDPTIESD